MAGHGEATPPGGWKWGSGDQRPAQDSGEGSIKISPQNSNPYLLLLILYPFPLQCF